MSIVKTLDEFVRRLKLTKEGKERLRRKGVRPLRRTEIGMGTDTALEPNLVDCRSICGPEDIDLCRKHGIHVCSKRHKNV